MPDQGLEINGTEIFVPAGLPAKKPCDFRLAVRIQKSAVNASCGPGTLGNSVVGLVTDILGNLEIELSDGTAVSLDKEYVEVVKKLTLDGREVETFQVRDVLVAIEA